MKLTPVEKERLWLFLAAELARKRHAAGLRLNHPEAVALISDEVIEAARAGKSYDEARAAGYAVLSEQDVLDGVEELVDRIQVEPTLRRRHAARHALLPRSRPGPAGSRASSHRADDRRGTSAERSSSSR